MQALRYRKEVCLCGVFYNLQFYGPENSTTLHNRLRGKQVRIKLYFKESFNSGQVKFMNNLCASPKVKVLSQ